MKYFFDPNILVHGNLVMLNRFNMDNLNVLKILFWRKLVLHFNFPEDKIKKYSRHHWTWPLTSKFHWSSWILSFIVILITVTKWSLIGSIKYRLANRFPWTDQKGHEIKWKCREIKTDGINLHNAHRGLDLIDCWDNQNSIDGMSNLILSME